jgi:hypothetical protein
MPPKPTTRQIVDSVNCILAELDAEVACVTSSSIVPPLSATLSCRFAPQPTGNACSCFTRLCPQIDNPLLRVVSNFSVPMMPTAL